MKDYLHPFFPNQPFTPAMVFISINNNLHQEWGQQTHQLRWGNLCWQAVQHAHHWFLESKASPPRLQQLYDFLSDERMKIAFVLHQYKKDARYGYSRFHENAITYHSSFSAARVRNQHIFKEMTQDYLSLTPVDKSLNRRSQLNAEQRGIYFQYQDQLPKIIFSVYYKNNEFKAYYPEKADLQLLFTHCDSLWQTLWQQRDSLTHEQKYRQLAEILWHLALARPLEYGSAGTAELLYHTFCMLLNLPLFPMQTSYNWDIKAMFTPNASTFANWFIADCLQGIEEYDPLPLWRSMMEPTIFSIDESFLLDIQRVQTAWQQYPLQFLPMLPNAVDKYNLPITVYGILPLNRKMHAPEQDDSIADNHLLLAMPDKNNNSLMQISCRSGYHEYICEHIFTQKKYAPDNFLMLVATFLPQLFLDFVTTNILKPDLRPLDELIMPIVFQCLQSLTCRVTGKLDIQVLNTWMALSLSEITLWISEAKEQLAKQLPTDWTIWKRLSSSSLSKPICFSRDPVLLKKLQALTQKDKFAESAEKLEVFLQIRQPNHY